MLDTNKTSFIYTPNANFFGEDSFRYKAIDDANASSNTATVLVSVASVPDPATISGVTSASISEDNATVSGEVSVTDPDPQENKAQIVDMNGTYGRIHVDATGLWIYTLDTTNADVQALAQGESLADNFAQAIKSEDNGTTADINVTILGANDAPTLNSANIATVSVKKQTDLNITVAAQDVDHNATLRLTQATSSPDANVTYDANGTITFNATDAGFYTLRYTFSDEYNATVDGEIAVTVTLSDPPVANDDNVTVAEDSNITFDPLANDTDDNNAIRGIAIVTQPHFGHIVVESNNSVTYTPFEDYNGADSFVYTVTDEDNGTSAPADVNITVSPVNDAPRFISLPTEVVANEDTNLSVEVNATAVDRGESLRISDVNSSDTTLATVSFDNTEVNASSADTIAVLEKTITVIPQKDAVGDVNITVTLEDNSTSALSAQKTFLVHILPVNDAPVIQPIADLNVTEDHNATVDLNISDVDNNLSQLQVQVVSSDPQTVVPEVNASTNGVYTLTLIPQPDKYGAVDINVTVGDGNLTASQSFMFTVTPVNDAPIAHDDNVTVAMDTTNNIIDILQNDFDVDSNLSIKTCDTNTTQSGTVTLADNNTTVSYTPQNSYIGLDSFECTVTDGEFDANETVFVNVFGNHAPIAPANTVLTMTLGETIYGNVGATDPDVNDTLTYTVAYVSPEVNGSGTTLTPDGNFSITAYKDGNGTIDINVTDSGNGDVAYARTTVIHYTISVVEPKAQTDEYDLSGAGGKITSADFDNLVAGSHPAMPADTKLYGFNGIETENNISVLDEDYLQFDSNGTFERLDGNETRFGGHDGNWTGVMQVSQSDPFDVNSMFVQGIMLDDNVSVAEINSSLPFYTKLVMPEGAVVYKTAVRFMKDQYYMDRAAEVCTASGCTQYTSLADMIDNNATGVVGYNKINDKRVFVFTPDSNYSTGSGVIAEVDMTAVYNGTASQPFVVNPNAGSWESATFTDDNDNNFSMVKITYNDNVASYDKYAVLIDFDANGTVEGQNYSEVMRGSFEPAGTSAIEYRFNGIAASVIANKFKPLTIPAYRPYQGQKDVNASDFDNNVSVAAGYAGLRLYDLEFEIDGYREAVLSFVDGSNFNFQEIKNGAVKADMNYTYSVVDTNVTLLKDSNDNNFSATKVVALYDAKTASNMLGLQLPEGALMFDTMRFRYQNELYPAENNGELMKATVLDANDSNFSESNVTIEYFIDNAQADADKGFMTTPMDENNVSYMLAFDANSSVGSGILKKINLDDGNNTKTDAGTWAFVTLDINGTTPVRLVEVNMTSPETRNFVYYEDNSTDANITYQGEVDYANMAERSYEFNKVAMDVILANFKNKTEFIQEEISGATVYGVILSSGQYADHFVTRYEINATTRQTVYGNFTFDPTQAQSENYAIQNGNLYLSGSNTLITREVNNLSNCILRDVNNSSVEIHTFLNQMDATQYYQSVTP